MQGVVLINKQGRYARPVRASGFCPEKLGLDFSDSLNAAYVWTAYETHHAVYRKAIEAGCIPLPATEHRIVTLGEK